MTSVAAVAAPTATGGVGKAASEWEAAWHEWHAARLAAAQAPHGQAALVLTRWLSADGRHDVPGLPGTWEAAGDAIYWHGVPSGEVTLADGRIAESPLILGQAGEAEARFGEVVVRPFARDGVLAVRVFDPAAERRVRLTDIATFAPAERWRIAARFLPRLQAREVELADGYRKEGETVGELDFELDGQAFSLTVSGQGAALSLVFGDATNGDESYGFRFLSVPLPDADGNTVIDFNRAYLPPCAFSDQFVCPLPGAENRLAVAIRAGERQVVLG